MTTRALSLSRLAYDWRTCSDTGRLAADGHHPLGGSDGVGLRVRPPGVSAAGRPRTRSRHARAAVERNARGVGSYLERTRPAGLAAVRYLPRRARRARRASCALTPPRRRGLSPSNRPLLVIVNTVVIVQALLQRPQNDVAVALGLFGGGSMLAALLLPRVLDRLPDRTVMLPAAAFLGVVLLGFAATTWAASSAGLCCWPPGWRSGSGTPPRRPRPDGCSGAPRRPATAGRVRRPVRALARRLALDLHLPAGSARRRACRSRWRCWAR